MFNAFYENTLLSVESFQTNNAKDAAEIFVEREKQFGKFSNEKYGEQQFKQDFGKYGESIFDQAIFYTKKHLYVLTAASRTSETVTAKRFLDSARFNIASNQNVAPPPVQNSDAVKFSKIKPYA